MLRVTVLEIPAQWDETARVLIDVDDAITSGPPTDLVVLPEAALTGYVSPRGTFALTPFAEPLDGPSARFLAAMARKHSVHLLAPLVLRESSECFNSAVLFNPSGEVTCVYRKRHPWFPETWATPGGEPHPVVEILGVRTTIAICFDIHFLEDDALETLRDAELLLFPSAWVDDHDSRTPLLTALAERHRIAIANANWGPGVVRMNGQGGSFIVDKAGRMLARASKGARRIDATISFPRPATS